LTEWNVVAEARVASEIFAEDQRLKLVGVSANRFPAQHKGLVMDENRVTGTARNIGGKVEEGFGRVTGDTKSQAEGVANQAAGAAQDLYGQARDSAADAAGAVRDSAASLEKWLRHTIETQPYTTALVAVGIGWLLGRMHRPL
jgi:uncharacterized protein YjbJ (UPF0337 family)